MPMDRAEIIPPVGVMEFGLYFHGDVALPAAQWRPARQAETENIYNINV